MRRWTYAESAEYFPRHPRFTAMTQASRWLRGAAAAAATILVTSCYYDPAYYAGGGGGGGGYYGDGGGGGYGSASIGTTFVYTSSDRWLYDPDVYCYYDRHSRRYYDPYLNGYYPVGYCPRPIYGASHPHGWRPGHNHLAPPSGFRDRILPNYQNRVNQLKQANYAWASKVRERNDATVDAWRNQRANAAANYQYSRDAQAGRNQQLRDNQAQRQQSIRDQQQNWADRVREQRQGTPQQQLNRQTPPANQPRQPFAEQRERQQQQFAALRAQQQQQQQLARQRGGQAAPPQPAVRAPQPARQGQRGAARDEEAASTWKEKVQERRANR